MKNNACSGYSCSRGMTLVEVLVALAMGSVLMGAVYTVYTAQIRGYAVQSAYLDMQQGIRSALLTMKDEIRTAGTDPTGRAGAEIIVAGPDEFHFTRDVNDLSHSGRFDGVISARKENIRYKINSKGSLGRDTCRPKGAGKFNCTGLQGILDNVDALDFVYLDYGGNPIDDAALQTAGGRNRIRQVQMTLLARYPHSKNGLLGGHTDNRMYRNRQGDALVEKPFGDHNHRLKMTATIALRNR